MSKKEFLFSARDNRLSIKKDLTANQKDVLTLIMRMLETNDRFFASNNWISKMTGISIKTVSTTITYLTQRGFVTTSYDNRSNREIHIYPDNQAALDNYLGTMEEYLQWYQNMVECLRSKGETQIPKVEGVNEPFITPTSVSATESVGAPIEDKGSVDGVLKSNITLLKDEKPEPETKFGEPHSVEYLYGGRWWPMNNSIDKEVIILRDYLEGITPEIIKYVCDGQPVDFDLNGFDFRYVQKASA
ncbi:helix-turn-helix domain-containing protein [Salinimicrobium sp. CDJ15-81-2]|nr:helix-turn-helix domain-containing protein [Salinimicrobium nanhaiense]